MDMSLIAIKRWQRLFRVMIVCLHEINGDNTNLYGLKGQDEIAKVLAILTCGD